LADAAMTSSIVVFRKYIVPVGSADEPRLDASAVLSAACFDEWLRTRGHDMGAHPEKVYKRCAPLPPVCLPEATTAPNAGQFRGT